jgi:hypothetical protein
VRFHGVAKRIISNQGSMFIGQFWTSFQEALGTQLKFSTRSPRDRQTDRTNKPNLGGHVVYVRDVPKKALGRILATRRICL